MSPEQLLGEEVVHGASDVYSLGVTMFECLSGSTPYTGNYAQVLVQACSQTPVPSLAAVASHVPAALSVIVERAMAKSLSYRFQTADDLAAALLSCWRFGPNGALDRRSWLGRGRNQAEPSDVSGGVLPIALRCICVWGHRASTVAVRMSPRGGS